jgi:hypothetical protein
MSSLVVVESGDHLGVGRNTEFDVERQNGKLPDSDPRLKQEGTCSPETISGQDSTSCSPQENAESDASTNKSDVGSVVAKAKRAASSLWMLIHAQVRSVQSHL